MSVTEQLILEAMCDAFVKSSGKEGRVVWFKDMRAALTIARKALTSSPTPYVRPAAEIQAEIERVHREGGRSYEGIGYVAGLTFALTPPTTGDANG